MGPKSIYAIRFAVAACTWLFVVGVTVQVLLVGLSLLGGRPLWSAHVDLGHAVGILLPIMLILAYVGKSPRGFKAQMWLLFAIYILQAEIFAIIRATLPLPAALHPLLAMVLFWLGISVAQQAGALVRFPETRATAPLPLAEATLAELPLADPIESRA